MWNPDLLGLPGLMDTAFPVVDEFGTLIDVLLAGDHAAALAETQRLIQAGHPAEKIVTAGLETAMRRLDDKSHRRKLQPARNHARRPRRFRRRP